MIVKLELTCKKCNLEYGERFIVNELRPDLADIPIDNDGCPRCGHQVATTTVPEPKYCTMIYGSTK